MKREVKGTATPKRLENTELDYNKEAVSILRGSKEF
jgi:hypothetical protein